MKDFLICVREKITFRSIYFLIFFSGQLTNFSLSFSFHNPFLIEFSGKWTLLGKYQSRNHRELEKASKGDTDSIYFYYFSLAFSSQSSPMIRMCGNDNYDKKNCVHIALCIFLSHPNEKAGKNVSIAIYARKNWKKVELESYFISEFHFLLLFFMRT